MKTALITGITGQDGALLARHLLESGYRVCGTTRAAPGEITARRGNLEALAIADQVELVSLDPATADIEHLTRLLQELAPAEIYHLAGQSSVGLSFSRPLATFSGIAVGTARLLEALRVGKLPARLCLAGSGDALAAPAEHPVTEETPFAPRSPYAAAKAAACWQARIYRQSYGMFIAVALLFNHESSLRPESFVTRKIIRAVVEIAAGRQGKLELGNLAIIRDWGWAPEYVRAMHLMLQHDTPADYLVATGHSFSLQEFVAQAFALKGLDWRRYTVSSGACLRPDEHPVHWVDPSFIAARLGWRAGKKMPEVVAAMLAAEEAAA